MTGPATDVRDRVEAWVADPANVSEQQRVAVQHPGDAFIQACPGAGKTRTVGVRLAWWSAHTDRIEGVDRRRRIAALSYTNVAVEAIASAAEAAGSPISEPDFLGTIHSFLLRYVVRPFGMQVMGCAVAPRLVADHSSRRDILTFREGWATREISVWDLHFRSDGSLTVQEGALPWGTRLSEAGVLARIGGAARAKKLALAAEGLMSMSDVLYWAQKALETPENARAVANRFDELIVDEAQDTMETQLQCLQLLKAAGLRSLVLIGDPDQAIYGFAGVNPKDLADAVTNLQLATLPLTQNYRSSQRICNVAAHFRPEGRPDDAVGDHRDDNADPELIVFPADDYRAAVERFGSRLAELAIEESEAAVVCWHRRTRDTINSSGGGTFAGPMADFAELAAVVQQQHTIGRSAVTGIESELAANAWPDLIPEEFDSDQRYQLRNAVFALAERLPDLGKPASQWCKEARAAISATMTSLREDGGTVSYKKNAPRGTGRYIVAELIAGRREMLRADTIHSVKGESHGATLVVALVDDVYNHASAWLHADGEERRIGYVAITRAERFMAVAVPDTVAEADIEEYIRRGFKLVRL